MLLLVFLFNVGGYYLVFWALQFQADKQINYKLDSNQLDPEETIELKIPVALPYPIYAQGFERVDGRFEHQGEFFRLVKHKFENDTLYIVCIRDRETRELVNTMDDYVQLTQALPATNQKAWNFISKLIKDFFPRDSVKVFPPAACCVSPGCIELPRRFLQPIIPVQAPPPKV